MIKEYGKIEGDVIVDDVYHLHGLVTGNIIVVEKGHCEIFGLCSGNVIVNEGGKLIIYGVVSRDVKNNGGDVEVYGMIVGRMVTENDGKTHISIAAKILNHDFSRKNV